MIELKEINLENKDELSEYLRYNETSEFTFTNMFCWRSLNGMQYFELDGAICFIWKNRENNTRISFPIGNCTNLKGTIEKVIQYFEEIGEPPRIYLYNEKVKELFNGLFPEQFIIEEDVNHADYIYNVKELINLSGNKYHKKKNHINKFKSLYSCEYKKVTAEEIPECKRIFNEWYNSKTELASDTYGERTKIAIYELFNNFDKLDAVGGAIYVDGKMTAFSFGEKLGNNIVDIYYEYADISYEGVYQIMNQQFLEHEWSNLEFANRECDLGYPGLRKSKLSYHPEYMARKYVAMLK